MKPGIYLIEVKECEVCKGAGELDINFVAACRACDTRGYTETRIDAGIWFWQMTAEVEREKAKIIAQVKGE